MLNWVTTLSHQSAQKPIRVRQEQQRDGGEKECWCRQLNFHGGDLSIFTGH